MPSPPAPIPTRPDEETKSPPPESETTPADVANAANAAEVFAAFLLLFSKNLPRLPAPHRAAAVRSIEEILFQNKPEARARLSLLACIDTFAAERTVGTGLRELFSRHFPDLGSARDLGVLANRSCDAYREYAMARLRWLYAGPYVDVQAHLSVSVLGVLGELMHAGEAPAPATEPRPYFEPWVAEPSHAAFAIVASFHVSRPAYGAVALSHLDRVAHALSLWQPRMPGRWTSAADLMDAVGLGVKSETLRSQWNEFEQTRGRGDPVITIALDPL